MDIPHLFWHLIRFVVVWAASYSYVFAGTMDPNTPDANYIAFGAKFPNVIVLTGQIPCDNPDCTVKVHTQKGSAVVIRPHWVLTAAHVVLGATEHLAMVLEDTKLIEYRLPLVVPHKDFDNTTFGVHDIALCYSPKKIEMEFYPALYAKDDELGKPITFAGWGAYGTFLTGATKFDDKRRAGQNKISAVVRTSLLCTPRRSGRYPLEFMIASGDSGGGMFIGNELAGINSFLMSTDSKPDGTYGDESAFTRVSLYVQWIEDQIAAHEALLAEQK